MAWFENLFRPREERNFQPRNFQPRIYPASTPLGNPPAMSSAPPAEKEQVLAIEVFDTDDHFFSWYVIDTSTPVGRNNINSYQPGHPGNALSEGIAMSVSEAQSRAEKAANRIREHGHGKPVKRWVEDR